MLLESFATRTHTVDHNHPSEPPEMYSLHQGTVQGIQTFGCFVELPGFRSNGLVHITQIRNDKRVELVRRTLFARNYCFFVRELLCFVRELLFVRDCYLSGRTTVFCQGLQYFVRDYLLFLTGGTTFVRGYYCFVGDYHLSRDHFVAQCTIYERSLLTVAPLFPCR